MEMNDGRAGWRAGPLSLLQDFQNWRLISDEIGGQFLTWHAWLAEWKPGI